MTTLAAFMPTKSATRTTTCSHCGAALAVYDVAGGVPAPCKCADAAKEREQRRADKLARVAAAIDRENAHLSQAGRRFDGARLYGVFARLVEALSVGTPRPDGRNGLLVTGRSGSGKTYAVAAVATALEVRGWDVEFTSSVHLMDAIKATFGNPEAEAATVAKYSRCGLLAIDDLGKECPSDWSLGVLFRIIDARYADRLPVVVTTDRSHDQLYQRWARADDVNATAILRRLRDMTLAVDMAKERKGAENAEAPL
jgi:DNA replication protein DnaC/primosomal protein DnaI